MTGRKQRDRDDLFDLGELDEEEPVQPLWGLPLRAENFVDGAPVSTVDCFELLERGAGVDARAHVERTLLDLDGLFELGPREEILRLYFFKRWSDDLVVSAADIIGIVTLSQHELRLETNGADYTASLRGTIEQSLAGWLRYRDRHLVDPFDAF